LGEEEERELLREIIPDQGPDKIDAAQRMLVACIPNLAPGVRSESGYFRSLNRRCGNGTEGEVDRSPALTLKDARLQNALIFVPAISTSRSPKSICSCRPGGVSNRIVANASALSACR
jgi:hypothetical protein